MARPINGNSNGDDDQERTPDGYVIVPQRHSYNIRCGHVDFERPRRDDDYGEAHWRCPAWFLFDPYAEHDYQRCYCAQHRDRYLPGAPGGKPEWLKTVTTQVIHEMPTKA